MQTQQVHFTKMGHGTQMIGTPPWVKHHVSPSYTRVAKDSQLIWFCQSGFFCTLSAVCATQAVADVHADNDGALEPQRAAPCAPLIHAADNATVYMASMQFADWGIEGFGMHLSSPTPSEGTTKQLLVPDRYAV